MWSQTQKTSHQFLLSGAGGLITAQQITTSLGRCCGIVVAPFVGIGGGAVTANTTLYESRARQQRTADNAGEKTAADSHFLDQFTIQQNQSYFFNVVQFGFSWVFLSELTSI